LIWGTIDGKVRGNDFVWKVKVDGGSRVDIGEEVQAKNSDITLPLFHESDFGCLVELQELRDELQQALQQEHHRLLVLLGKMNDNGTFSKSKTVGDRCSVWSKTNNEYCWGTITCNDGDCCVVCKVVLDGQASATTCSPSVRC
jgi:hypothetical protein